MVRKLTLASPLVGYLLLTVGLLAVASAWRYRQPPTTADFTIFYKSAQQTSGAMFAHPPGPPRGNMNPPAFQLLIRPLTRFSLSTATVIFRGVNLVALAVCVWWLAVTADERWTLADYGALLAWAPMASVLGLNQLTWILWPLLMWTWWAWRQGKWTSGAISYGFALSLKPFLGVILLWLVIQRRWRAAGAALASAGALFLLGVLVYGVTVNIAWFRAMAEVSWAYAGMNASLKGLLSRTFTAPVMSSRPIADWPGMVAPASIVGGVSIVGVTLFRFRHEDVDRSWLPLIAAALLASPLGWLYYMWWMLPGNRPARLLLQTPLLWIPMVFPIPLEPSGWITATVGSIYFWGLLSLWVDRVFLAPVGEGASRRVGHRRIGWQLAVPAVICLAVVIGASRFLRAAQLAKNDPALGDWVLDKAETHLPADVAVESRTLALTADDDVVRRMEATVSHRGRDVVQFTARYDGHDVPVYGSSLETIALRRLDRYTVQSTGKIQGQVVEVETRRVSPDGKLLTLVTTAGNRTSVQVFRRP